MTPVKLIRNLIAATIKSYRATNESVRFNPITAEGQQRNAVRNLLMRLLDRHPTEAEIDEALDI